MGKRMTVGTALAVLTIAAGLVALVAPGALAQGGPGPGPGPGGGGGTTLTVFETSDFSGSGICASCHTGLADSAGTDVSIDTHWRSTMMANAAKDPLWQAKIESEIARNPDLQSVIEDKCSRCHTPMARTQAVTDGTPVAVLEGGFLDPAHILNAAALDGVSCTLCHQIADVGLGQPETFTGGYVIDTSTTAPDRLIYAKFANPLQGPMRNSSSFTPVQGLQTASSAMCATCHTLYTPSVDANGSVVGEFPEQMTYLEWEHSAFGDGLGSDRSCQDCHLPLASGGVKISNRPVRLQARSPFNQHYFVGGNAFMLNVMKSQLDALGVTASAAQMDATLTRTYDQLSTQTASLAVSHMQVANGTLTAVVTVENAAGHKLPSGIPARRAWLHLTVRDRRGNLIFESGRLMADGRIDGDDAAEGLGSFEPHHDLISSADQVQIYEPVMLNTDAEITYTLLRAASYAKDNRLLPLGFDKATASEDIAVQGAASTDDNFVGGSDQVTYSIDLQGTRGTLTVSVELLYEAVSYPFLNDLRLDTSDLVQRFAGYYDEADKSPAVLASVQADVR